LGVSIVIICGRRWVPPCLGQGGSDREIRAIGGQETYTSASARNPTVSSVMFRAAPSLAHRETDVDLCRSRDSVQTAPHSGVSPWSLCYGSHRRGPEC